MKIFVVFQNSICRHIKIVKLENHQNKNRDDNFSFLFHQKLCWLFCGWPNCSLCIFSIQYFFLLIYLLHQATCILGAEIYLLHLITYPSTESGIETRNSISINIFHKQQMKQRIELNHPVRKPKWRLHIFEAFIFWNVLHSIWVWKWKWTRSVESDSFWFHGL